MSEYVVEWIVYLDGDPGGVIYRGKDEARAREVFEGIVPVASWGGTLSRRMVGPTELVEVRR